MYSISKYGDYADVERIVKASYDNDQYLAICYMGNIECLFYHNLNGEVVQVDMETREEITILRTRILGKEFDVTPGSSLKVGREGKDLYVMSEPNKIVVLKNVKFKGYEKQIVVEGSKHHPFSNFIPISQGRLVTLSFSSMYTVFLLEGDNKQPVVIDRSFLKEKVGFKHQDANVTSFDVCTKEQFMVVAFNNNESDPTTKEKLALFDICGENTTAKLLDIYSYKDERNPGPSTITVNMGFYHQRYPVVICGDMDGDRKTEIFHIDETGIIKIDQFHDNRIGFTVKRKGRSLFSIDQFGNITQREVSIFNPDKAKVKKAIIDLDSVEFENPKHDPGSWREEVIDANPHLVNILRTKDAQAKPLRNPPKGYKGDYNVPNFPVKEGYPKNAESITERFQSRRNYQLSKRRNKAYNQNTKDYFTERNGIRFDKRKVHDPRRDPGFKSYLKRPPRRGSKREETERIQEESELFPWETQKINKRPSRAKEEAPREITIRDLKPSIIPHVQPTPKKNIQRSNQKSTTSTLDVTPNKPRNSPFERLVKAVKNPRVYKTGFDSCINIIPILTNYGYVSCFSDSRNSLAQYEILNNGIVKQSEILKSK